MRKTIFATVCAALPLLVSAQDAVDAFQLSQTDLRGTARFMSMAGAFGALGGDLSTLVQNPAGIGVYRSSDVGVTLDFDIQSSSAKNGGVNVGTNNQFKVNCNNAGYVGSYNLNSETVPNFNWGFTYNRVASFNRRYSGNIGSLNTSLSNYVAGLTNAYQWNEGDLTYGKDFDPYIDGKASWLSILSYQSYLISPDSKGNNFQGLYGDGTTGYGEFETIEQGGIDEYSINFGGNISNVLYWGLGFGITNIDYNAYTYYGESLNNAYIPEQNGSIGVGTANWGLVNNLHSYGNGYNFKMGLIFKPINEFRLGFAFHTPTYYSLTDVVYTTSDYDYSSGISPNYNDPKTYQTNGGYGGESWYKIKTPWRFIASAATVIGGRAILSFDYEYVGYNTMEVLSGSGAVYTDTKSNIENYYKASNIFRIGAEIRLTPQISARAGYSYKSSPVNEDALNNRLNITTSSTTPAYSFDKSTQYFTAGLGYKFKAVYFDLAYVHKTRESEYHAFSPVVANNGSIIENSPSATITDNNNHIVATLGFRF